MTHLGHGDFSPCRKYRYTLHRTWGEVPGGRFVMFIGLNPSTADEVQNDPTVRRCINYAKRWGYDGMCMTNIFAYRATDPRDMKAQDDPVGAHNDTYLLKIAKEASLIVAAWGVHGEYRDRGYDVVKMMLLNGINLNSLKTTKNGHPAHPLYLRSDIEPQPIEVQIT